MSETNNNSPQRDEEKLVEQGIVFVDPKMKKLDNFFYYHKWKILAAILVVAVLTVCILQSCETVGYDSYVIYSGPNMVTAADAKAYISAFNEILPYDLNGDGEKNVQLIATNILSAPQIESYEAVTDENGDKIYTIDREFNHSELERFDSLILTGEYSVCLLDPYLYDRVRSSGGFRRLDEVFDSVPNSAIDEYGIRFADTEFAGSHSVFSNLPEDTVLCLRTKGTLISIGGSANDSYALSEELFKAIVEYIPQ
ncbi:MAG: hypothetical protein IKA82_01500 [Clostridia bacterium]|nr:hypothetical protein [Clostridia bacterium]